MLKICVQIKATTKRFIKIRNIDAAVHINNSEINGTFGNRHPVHIFP